MCGTCTTHRRDKYVYANFAGKYEEKRHLGRPRRRIKDYVKMDSKENRGWIDSLLDLCDSEQRLMAGSYEEGNEFLCSIRGEEFLDQLGDH